MKRGLFVLMKGISLMLVSGTALAHEGHSAGSGFLSGMLHPLTGLDHLMVILAFGLMAGLWANKKRVGGLIVGFLTLFALSALVGSFSTAFAGSETILMSTVVAAAMLLLIKPLRGHQALMILFGLIAATTHGFVHGVELSSTVQSMNWLAGTTLSVGTMLVVAALAAKTLSAYQKTRKLAI